ncbi:fasciclin domain-containing protein [Arundinibacter roseus]|uniref:Fasciclin domain-containing protein n=2 Tax=Arundinibacter roseus TaxID=2070510 RepID=A0A4R4KBD6_9BACT|nr:fasciclin domain-containing protein [Arundinibacter roseus]
MGLLVGMVSACKDDEEEVAPMTITDVVLTNNDFTILRAAVQHAGLADALRTGTLTVFAPNDAAFNASGFADAAAITALPAATVRGILEYHVLGSTVRSADIQTADNQSVPTLATTPVYVTKNAAGVSVNGATVTAADISADNGVIHVINRVLLPPSQNLLEVVQGNSNFTLLLAAATRAAQGNPVVLQALTSDASAFTVFAPTNQAFIAAGFPDEAALNAVPAETLANIILYHVVPGRVFSTNLAAGNVTTAATLPVAINVSNGVTVTGTGNGTQGATVTTANVLASNGVVHIIDRVLLP